MPSPKDGTAGTLVPPAAPAVATDADDADPGAVETVKAQQRTTQSGKYGSVQCSPFKGHAAGSSAGSAASDPADPAKTSWIEIVLVDEDNMPIPGEAYEITLPDNTLATGTLDQKGLARVEGFQPGQCQVTFPRLDQEAWEAA